MIGRPVAEVAETLPRLFNLCRVAQAAAARLALGMTDDSDPRAEVIRDHLAQVYVTRRRALGLAPRRPDPAGICGPAGRLPADLLARIETLAGRLDRWIHDDAPPSLIHGDLWTGNVLVKDGRIAGFVDPAIHYADA
ncbi:MAG: phosphotransferase, partial [Gemmobacter sp.]